jgi:non-ribosomal peptide synthetase component E (peptide arylation enzyme)
MREGIWDKSILSDHWEKNAEEYPDREALVDSKGSRLTWREANQQINRIALAFVKDLKINKDERLIIQLPNCVEQVLARVACEKAGIISLALMTTFRETELKEIGKIIKPVGIIIPKKYRKTDFYQLLGDVRSDIPSLKHVIVIGDDVPEGCISWNRIVEHTYEKEYDPGELENRKLDAINDVGFLSHTTGTTGLPKVIENRIAARSIWASKNHIKKWQLSSDDVVVAIAPVQGGPGGTAAYFCAPIVGAKVVLVYEYKSEEILELLEKERATLFASVPTHLSRMVQLPVEKYDLSSLRFIRCSGGYLAPSLVDEAEEKFGRPILSTYGNQDGGSISGMSIDASKEVRRSTVGQPHPGNEIKILDDSGNEVKPDEIGQLYFRSPSAAIGYYRDLEKTMSEAFDKDGWTTTGDLVTLDDDGNIKIVGRKKDIIIRGGQNIYPGEIEKSLMAHPKVSEAAIVAMPDAEMGEKACAYVVPKEGEKFTFEEMVDYLDNKKIAKFKFPERLELIESLPLAGGSKINKKLMRQMIADKLKAEGKT